jgi:hypothetical protein
LKTNHLATLLPQQEITFSKRISIRVTRLGDHLLWAIIYFGQFYEKYTIRPNLRDTHFQGKSFLIIWTKNGLGKNLGDF